MSAGSASAVRYDAAGNVTSFVGRADVALSLAWNSLGQLVSVSTNGAFAESYAYGPLGLRVSTTDGSGTVYHVYDGDHCAADLDASGDPLRSYTWGAGVDNLLAVTVYGGDATNTYYAVKDHLGSVHALVDASGVAAESYTYDAWGNILSHFRTLELPNFSCRYLFQGREYSKATGLYNFRARWYAPEIGRWLSPDPIGLEGGLNLYEFCGCDPMNFTDPSGLCANDFIVVFVSDNTGVGDTAWHWLSWKKLYGSKAHIISGVSSKDDMLNKAEKFVASQGGQARIWSWALSGHGDGGAGVQTMNKEGINPSDFTDRQIGRMRRLLSPSEGAHYVTWGCGGGRAVNDLRRIAGTYNIDAHGWQGDMLAGPFVWPFSTPESDNQKWSFVFNDGCGGLTESNPGLGDTMSQNYFDAFMQVLGVGVGRR